MKKVSNVVFHCPHVSRVIFLKVYFLFSCLASLGNSQFFVSSLGS